MDSATLNTLSQTQTILYSFTAGYMVSQLNILGFALGCGFMYALNHIPHNIYQTLLENNLWKRFSQNHVTTFTTT
jgi:hypothetical protein